MKWFVKLLFFCFTITLVGASELKHADSYEYAIAKGLKENKNILMYTHSPYCPWCTKMENETLSNKKVIEFINKNYVYVSIDVEMDDFPTKFKPNGTPTTFIIDPKTQKKLYSLRGYKSPRSFLGRLKR